MKKVVVVTENENVFFEGADLEVINHCDANGASTDLVIMNAKKAIGMFTQWVYWKKLE